MPKFCFASLHPWKPVWGHTGTQEHPTPFSALFPQHLLE